MFNVFNSNTYSRAIMHNGSTSTDTILLHFFRTRGKTCSVGSVGCKNFRSSRNKSCLPVFLKHILELEKFFFRVSEGREIFAPAFARSNLGRCFGGWEPFSDFSWPK